jgi:hypothetical protein
MEARVTKAAEAIGERVRSTTTAAAAVGGHAQKTVQDAAAGTTTAANRVKTTLDGAGEAVQQAWSQAAAVAEDVVDAGGRTTRSVSRRIHETPLLAGGSGRLRARLRRGIVDQPKGATVRDQLMQRPTPKRPL